jgi:hypothetical protein
MKMNTTTAREQTRTVEAYIAGYGHITGVGIMERRTMVLSNVFLLSLFLPGPATAGLSPLRSNF